MDKSIDEDLPDMIFPSPRRLLALSKGVTYVPGSMFSVQPKLESLGSGTGKTFTVGISQSEDWPDRREKGVQLEPPSPTVSRALQTSIATSSVAVSVTSSQREVREGEEMKPDEDNVEPMLEDEDEMELASQTPSGYEAENADDIESASQTPSGSEAERADVRSASGSQDNEMDAASYTGSGSREDELESGSQSGSRKDYPEGDLPIDSSGEGTRRESLSPEESSGNEDTVPETRMKGQRGPSSNRIREKPVRPTMMVEPDPGRKSRDETTDQKRGKLKGTANNSRTEKRAQTFIMPTRGFVNEEYRHAEPIVKRRKEATKKLQSETKKTSGGKEPQLPGRRGLVKTVNEVPAIVRIGERRVPWDSLKMSDSTRELDGMVSELATDPEVHGEEEFILHAQRVIAKLSEALEEEKTSGQLMRTEIDRLRSTIDQIKRSNNMNDIRVKLSEAEDLIDYVANYRKRMAILTSPKSDPGEPLRQLVDELRNFKYCAASSCSSLPPAPVHVCQCTNYVREETWKEKLLKEQDRQWRKIMQSRLDLHSNNS